MPLRVSGFLDQGTDARDTERLLSSRSNRTRSRLQRDGNVAGYFDQGQRQQQQRRPLHEPVGNVHLQRAPRLIYEPLVTTQFHGQSRYSSEDNGSDVEFDANDKLLQSFIQMSEIDSRPTPVPTNRPAQLLDITKQNTNEDNQTKTFPKTSNEQESDTDEEDYITCCDFHSNSRQPLCNEGTKNLCTLTIWAVIIFAICNRFLMHMSLFLHRSDGVGKGVEGINNFEYDPVDLSSDVDATGMMKQNDTVPSSEREVVGHLGEGLEY